MEKRKTYKEIRFTAEAFQEAIAAFHVAAAKNKVEIRLQTLSVQHDDSSWSYDSLDEFYADYRKYKRMANLHLYSESFSMMAQILSRETDISVKGPSRAQIESTFSVFEKHAPACLLPPEADLHEGFDPVIFIGHGRSLLWRELKDHLQDKHGIKVSAYETGARAGHSIRDILEQLVEESSFALLLLTAEDEQADGVYRARQNVIHEAGLFQGRLGFARAIMVVEDGVESFSNADGIQQIRFSRGNIRETFGEVLATFRREFFYSWNVHNM